MHYTKYVSYIFTHILHFPNILCCFYRCINFSNTDVSGEVDSTLIYLHPRSSQNIYERSWCFMSKLAPDEIADYRYQMIAPVVSKNYLAHGERGRIIKSISSGTYEGVDYSHGCFSERTLERFINLYSEGKREALKPSKRGRKRRIPIEYMKKAAELRRENPSRSINRIIYMLEQSGEVPYSLLKNSTVYDYFVKKDLTNKAYAKKAGRFTRYGASYRMEFIQGDFHHTL